MDPVVHRLRGYWPLAVALAFCLYSWALLLNAFRAEAALQREVGQHIVSDSQRRAAGLLDLLGKYRQGLRVLADSPEVSNYQVNKALGMSLRYGLNANLEDIHLRSQRLLLEYTHRERALYRRILFFDAGGELLVDSAASSDLPLLPRSWAVGGGLVIEPLIERVLAWEPVLLKGALVGFIVAEGALEPLLRDLDTGDGEHFREYLLDRDGEITLRAFGEVLDTVTRERLSRLPLAQVQAVAAFDPDGGGRRWVGVRSEIGKDGLQLVSLLDEEVALGKRTQQRFLYVAASVPLIALIFALMYQRMRRVRAALAESRQRFRTVFENINDAILIVDQAQGRAIDCNPRALSMFACRREQLLSAPLTDYFPGDGEFVPAQWAERLQRAAAGELQVFVWRGRALNGRQPWLEMTLLQARFDGVSQLLLVAHDISLRREQEEKLREALAYQQQLNQKLEEAQGQLLQSEKMASIGQLAAGVAHEINNPIGFIHSNIGSLERYVDDLFALLDAYEEGLSATAPPATDGDTAQTSPLSADAARMRVRQVKERIDFDFLRDDMHSLISETRDGVQRVRKIVQDMKDFSHVDSHEWQWADLNAGLESTLNVVWNELKYKAEVVRELGELPEVECLPGQINQVLMNLLINAAHAIETRGRITLRSGCNGPEVWIEVEDTGKGIAPEHLNRIFDPFFTTKPVGQGTGLGLSLAYGIIRKHAGRFEVSSQPGQGSRFRIWLPIQRAQRTNEETQGDAA